MAADIADPRLAVLPLGSHASIRWYWYRLLPRRLHRLRVKAPAAPARGSVSSLAAGRSSSWRLQLENAARPRSTKIWAIRQINAFLDATDQVVPDMSGGDIAFRHGSAGIRCRG